MTVGTLAALVLSALGLFCPRTSSAQTPNRPRTAATPPRAVASPSPTPDDSQPATQLSAREVSEEEADLVITARVTARELKFDAVPNPSVEFAGKPERATNWETDRTNLPRPVQPGVTYRDVGVRLKIVSVFADIDRIVAEALGEVPTTDDTTHPTARPGVSPPGVVPPGATAAAPPKSTETNSATGQSARATAAAGSPKVNTTAQAPSHQGRTGRPRARRLR